MSAPVNTATTPSAASAADASIDGDVGAGVVGEPQRGVEHAGHADVVDVVAVAERELRRLVLGAGAADRGRQLRLELLADRDRLDRVEDLDVPGAAAEVGAEMRLHRRRG